MPSPIESMRIVAGRLEPLGVPFAFLGGAVVCLLVDRPDLTEFRPTKDVDVVVEVTTLSGFYTLEERLRAAGFQHDTSEGAPICRWIAGGCRVDMMPMDSTSLGMSSKWFPEVLRLSQATDLGGGCSARVVTAPLFVATKLEAFKDRGKGDLYASHDIEDIITVVDGCGSIVEQVAASPAAIRAYIAPAFSKLGKSGDFRDALPGHLSGISGARQRAPMVLDRISAIAALR